MSILRLIFSFDELFSSILYLICKVRSRFRLKQPNFANNFKESDDKSLLIFSGLRSALLY
jgi:hypothetical protein